MRFMWKKTTRWRSTAPPLSCPSSSDSLRKNVVNGGVDKPTSASNSSVAINQYQEGKSCLDIMTPSGNSYPLYPRLDMQLWQYNLNQAGPQFLKAMLQGPQLMGGLGRAFGPVQLLLSSGGVLLLLYASISFPFSI